MEFFVRPAEPRDAERICEIAREAWHAAYDDIVGQETVDEQVDEWYDPEAIRDRAEGAPHFYVAVTVDVEAKEELEERGMESAEDVELIESGFEKEVVGFASGGIPEDSPEEGFITSLYVDPDYWNEGIGTKLAGSLAVDFAAAAAEEVVAVVVAGNDVGREFYTSLGFEERERHVGEIGDQEVEQIEFVADVYDLA